MCKTIFSFECGTQKHTEGNCKKMTRTTSQHASFCLPCSLDLPSKFPMMSGAADERRLQEQQTDANLGGHVYSLFFFLLRPPFSPLQIILQVISRSFSLRLEGKRCEHTHVHRWSPAAAVLGKTLRRRAGGDGCTGERCEILWCVCV